MMAIFTPLRCSVRALMRRGDGLQVEQRAAADWAGDVIGLERAAACRLQNVVGQPQRLAGAGFAAHEDRVANAVRQQRADDDRGAEQGDLGFAAARGSKPQAILEQDWIVPAQPLQLRGQQAKRGDGRQGVPSFTVTSWVSQLTSKSRVGSISQTFRSS